MNDQDKLKKRISYIKAVIFWLVAFVATVIIEEPFQKTELSEIIGKLSNCFTVPGVIFAGFAGLTYVSYLGGYDGISYAFTSFGLHNIFTTRQPKRYKDFYEYKKEKDEKGRSWLPQYLIIGLISLAIGVLLLVLYYVI